MTKFYMPPMQDDEDGDETALHGFEIDEILQISNNHKMPEYLEDKLNGEQVKLREEPRVELSIFEEAENAINDLDTVHWASRLYAIRNLAYRSRHLAISDCTNTLLRHSNIHKILWIIPIISETLRTELDPLLSSAIFGAAPSQYVAEVIVVFGAKSSQRLRWLTLNFGEDKESAELFGVEVSRLS